MRSRAMTTLAAILLAGGAMADEPSDRFEKRDVCDFLAAYSFEYPPPPDFEPGRSGLWQRDGYIRQGVIDLDGDGSMESVTDGDMGRHGGDLFNITRADRESLLEGANMGGVDEPGGFGAGFMSFDGRWYMVVFARQTAALVTGAFTFERGSLHRQLACRFDNDIVETMVLPDPNAIDDGTCPGLAERVKAGRLKPSGQLTEGQLEALRAALDDAIGPYAEAEPYQGTELYTPNAGPFAGQILWKAALASSAGEGGCYSEAFIALTPDGEGFTVTGGEVQQRLNALQSRDGSYPFDCAVHAHAAEVDGTFYVERASGTDKPDADELLHRSIWIEDGNAPRELCRARYQITPRVTWRATDAP